MDGVNQLSEDKTEVNILCCDGGGTRGVISLAYLEEVEKRIKKATGKELWQYFKLICGTSTGSLIAFAIGLLHWSVDKIEQQYLSLAKAIFPAQFSQMMNKVSYHEKANSDELVNILTEVYSEEGRALLLSEYPPVGDQPYVFAVASESNMAPSPYLFRNFRHPKIDFEGTDDDTIVHSLQASTAAPVYFQPLRLRQTTFKDGGLVANNPTLIALQAARVLFGPRIRIVLSIGTGMHENSATDWTKDVMSPAITFIEQAVALMTSSETINKEVEIHLNAFKDSYGPSFKGLVRMNVTLPKYLQGLAITDNEKLAKMQHLAKEDYKKNKEKYNLHLND